MKIALLTIWHDGNYGAELQAYATIKILKELGHDVEIIDIRLSDKDSPSFNGRVGSFISSFGPAYMKFQKFWKKYFPTTKRYKSLKDLQQDPPKADVYMVGSDQVWNPDLTKQFVDLYFLNFGSDDLRRVSYASSFGTDCWAYPEIRESIKVLLSRFDFVSCREQSGIDILKKEFSINATNVLDPTLLFTNYNELTGKLQEQQTLVYYPLSKFPQLSSYAESLANRLHLEVQNANWSKNVYRKIVWDRNSIEEWVKAIGQARFVITPSFHGVAMSLIHKRQFAVVVAHKERATRIVSILTYLGLEDRIYESLEALDKDEPWKKVIDYKYIDEKLRTFRDNSISYLKKSLS